MPWRRVLRLSRDMTQGDKMEIWIVELSFLGWMLLALGITFTAAYLFGPALQSLFPGLMVQFRALTHAKPLSSQYWFMALDSPIQYAAGYAGKLLMLHLAGMALYYLFNLFSTLAFLLVAPYFQGTIADLYAVMRARVLVRSLAEREELPGFGWPDEEKLEEAMRPDEPPKVLVEPNE